MAKQMTPVKNDGIVYFAQDDGGSSDDIKTGGRYSPNDEAGLKTLAHDLHVFGGVEIVPLDFNPDDPESDLPFLAHIRSVDKSKSS